MKHLNYSVDFISQRHIWLFIIQNCFFLFHVMLKISLKFLSDVSICNSKEEDASEQFEHLPSSQNVIFWCSSLIQHIVVAHCHLVTEERYSLWSLLTGKPTVLLSAKVIGLSTKEKCYDINVNISHLNSYSIHLWWICRGCNNDNFDEYSAHQA